MAKAMENRVGGRKKKRLKASSSHSVESQLQYSGEVAVVHHATPVAGPSDLKIHVRQPLPLIPDAPPRTKKNK
jgi:hypothetical protein